VIDPKRANALVGVGVAVAVVAAGYVAYQTFHAQERGLRSIEDRIERSRPRTGEAPPERPRAAVDAIRVSLERSVAAPQRPASTRITLDADAWTLEDDAPSARADVVWGEVAAAIGRRRAARPDATGEIVTRADDALDALAMRAFDAFLAAGVSDVAFVGTPTRTR